MNLYLDTEFDGHGGKLLSMALVGDDESRWYAVFDDRPEHPWVKEHVKPHLFALTPTIDGDMETLRLSLSMYLMHRPNSTIWADWPADFEYLMQLMRGSSFEESFVTPCTMRLINTPDGEPKPKTPHNALSDALALCDWHQRTSDEP